MAHIKQVKHMNFTSTFWCHYEVPQNWMMVNFRVETVETFKLGGQRHDFLSLKPIHGSSSGGRIPISWLHVTIKSPDEIPRWNPIAPPFFVASPHETPIFSGTTRPSPGIQAGGGGILVLSDELNHRSIVEGRVGGVTMERCCKRVVVVVRCLVVTVVYWL